MSDLERMGTAIAKSNLFGLKTAEQAIALMLVAQAEGLHPAIAARDYHVIEGRPSLKADAMLARFLSAGGCVEWHELTDTKASATFKHEQGGSTKIEWDIPRAKRAEVYREKTSAGKTGMWVKYPRQMLRARVISEGVRTIYPNANGGLYTPEEVQDFDDNPATRVEIPVEIIPDAQGVPEIPAAASEAIGAIHTDDGIVVPALDGYISAAQRQRIFAIAAAHGVSDEVVKGIVKAEGFESTKLITSDKYDLICETIVSEGTKE
jgi:hypothetical protein